jgi:hypothetical protein
MTEFRASRLQSHPNVRSRPNTQRGATRLWHTVQTPQPTNEYHSEVRDSPRYVFPQAGFDHASLREDEVMENKDRMEEASDDPLVRYPHHNRYPHFLSMGSEAPGARESEALDVRGRR